VQENRRQFVKLAAATSLSTARILGANDRIRVGVIGTGGRGRLLMGLFNKCPDAEIVAVCDVYEPRISQAKEKDAPQARQYRDYRQILDQQDIDAVVIATPNHWHSTMALSALGAGKDIYLEKPVTHTLEEGPRLQAAVEASKQVVQTGTQNRSMPHFFEAREIVASGALGKISFVETYFYQNYARINPSRFSVDAAKLDWKSFLGPAPDQPVDPMRFQWWRWFWDFGEGTLTDLFTHVVDVSHWFLGKDLPTTASATGTNSLLPRWETPDTVNACFEYPGGLLVVFNSMMGGSLQGGGTLFRGTKAMLRISRSGFEMWDEPDQLVAQGPVTAPPKREAKAEGDVVLLHVKNFLDCMRSRKTPNAPIGPGIACARAGHLGNLALRKGRKINSAG
jgi:predicted dehydrogenase